MRRIEYQQHDVPLLEFLDGDTFVGIEDTTADRQFLYLVLKSEFSHAIDAESSVLYLLFSPFFPRCVERADVLYRTFKQQGVSEVHPVSVEWTRPGRGADDVCWLLREHQLLDDLTTPGAAPVLEKKMRE